MKTLYSNKWWLKTMSLSYCASLIVLCLVITVIKIQRDEARNDANIFFDELIEFREYKETQIRLDSIKLAKKAQEWNALINALIIVESEGIENAIGDNGKAVGILQIHPIVIEDLRIAGYNYNLEDRLDREKSIDIWSKWMDIYNPEKDIYKSLKRHNPKMSWEQQERIIRLIQIIIENDSIKTEEGKSSNSSPSF